MAKGSSSHSLPLSSSPIGDKVEYANEDDSSGNTELFEDTLVLDNNPFSETEVQSLNIDTELVEDSDLAENMATGSMCELQQEVVLDSEDDRDEVTVDKGFLEDETSFRLKAHSMLFQKKWHKPSCEPEDPNVSTFEKAPSGDKGASVDAESFDDNNHLHLPARLNHIHSPEPGGSTEAALGFVDQYLSSNKEDFFQEIHCRKTTREKSPHVMNSMGPLNLAKKIKTRTQNEEKEHFKWVDIEQNDNKAGMFGKAIEASSNFGRYKRTYVRRRQKNGGHLQSQINCNSSNRCAEKLGQGPQMVTENNNSLKELDVQSSPGRDVNVHSSATYIEDMSGIGLGTQIAAEAMEALAFMPPSGFHFNDAYQPMNVSDDSLSNLTENEAHLNFFSYQQDADLHSIRVKTNEKSASSSRFSKETSSSSCKLIDNQEPNLVSRKMKKMMKSKSTIEGQFESSMSLEEFCSLGEYTSFQSAAKEPKSQNSESRWARTKDQPSHHSERNNNVKEKGIIRHKRKGNNLVADPVKLGVRIKHAKLPINSCVVARSSQLNHHAQVSPRLSATRSFPRIYSWVYPKRPRGKRKVANLDALTVLCTDEKESNVFSTRSQEDQDHMNKFCFPHTTPLCNASYVDDGRCLIQGNSALPDSAGNAIKSENLHNMPPLLVAHVEISSNKSIAQLRSDISAEVATNEGTQISNANHKYTVHRKKPCDKNLPKSSLLKELIRLGVPESMSDIMWKDLRHRRDMTDVRVLFSQHLDDSIIKQQKKILARLNIFVASCSMEATHFIADKFTRTKNMLETMALGKLVVTHLWIESCGQANCFIDEKNYILRDMKKEKEIGFSMPVSLARARQNPLLKGKRVYITPHTKPDKEVVASLVTAVQGQVVDESQVCANKNDNILDDLLILSCEDDYAICHHFLRRGIAVYSSELVLNGIVIQKLELERHQLFLNQITRNNSSTRNRFGKIYRRR
ncbi:hypothetical protein RJT34_19453 [Clitoria ternatea]|uniref:BRCT domain-containing protein n=1 Tax=Clitoria ternatea TaxID=43366 RepID=A0AAN9P3R6_CLITE